MENKEYFADQNSEETIKTTDDLPDNPRDQLRFEMERIRRGSLEAIQYDRLRRKAENRLESS